MSIYQKLIKVQVELKAPKSQYNGFGKYNYRNCEDILESVKPLLQTHGLTLHIHDEVVMIGDRYYIKACAALIDIEDGETIQNIAYAREESEKKGMDGSQITGASSSYARKYALNGLFLIDDTKDSDTANESVKDENKATPQNETPPTPPVKNISDAQVKRLLAIAKKKGYDVAVVKKQVLTKYNKTSLNDLIKAEYEELVKGYESLADKEK